ncbi:phage integrase N-terminal SAM-like domain-containing protein [Nitrococcus mobilis]|uniref:Integron integrase n=1 Tax=Nitrococcus mobilis Nb-231 TaxID=314278 RepID=A4BR68_9GAMM|nr:phage integrase N-terminal SAM-like domain-containing protein [Nitrococcus mobilis]EAR21690.1 Integron integrase [Nitrococcus mobilis Nb-231]
MAQEPRLLDQARDRVRFRHYSIRTEQTYLGWTRRFILFYKKRHPREMGTPEVERFLSALATEYNVRPE